MSASFAKAVMPRMRRENESRREPDWTLGWVFSIKTDLPKGVTPSADAFQTASEPIESNSATTVADDFPSQDCP
jgi:hypothetical protein